MAGAGDYRLAMEISSDVMYEYTVDTDTLVAYEPQVDAAGHSYVEKMEFPCYEAFLQQEDFVHPDERHYRDDNFGGEKFTESRAFAGLSGENPFIQRTSITTD